MLGSWYTNTKDYVKEMVNLKDSGQEKKGLNDWINAELIGSLIFDVQKQTEEILNRLKPAMHGRYWRLNPPLKEEIKLDKAGKDDQKKMENAVNEYLATEEATTEIKKLVDNLIQPEDYEARLLKYLLKAASIVEYNTIIQKQ